MDSRSAGKEVRPWGKLPPWTWISHQLCPCCTSWETNRNRLHGVQFSVITFLAFKDITAVSWLAAGLAEGHGALSTWALGLRAGMEVTSALGRYGGAATTRWRVTLGQDWTLGARRHLQSRTRHRGTPQLFWNTQIWMHIHIKLQVGKDHIAYANKTSGATLASF